MCCGLSFHCLFQKSRLTLFSIPMVPMESTEAQKHSCWKSYFKQTHQFSECFEKFGRIFKRMMYLCLHLLIVDASLCKVAFLTTLMLFIEPTLSWLARMVSLQFTTSTASARCCEVESHRNHWQMFLPGKWGRHKSVKEPDLQVVSASPSHWTS